MNKFSRAFMHWLQDIKYVLLRLQKAITRVEQGMKVTILSSDVVMLRMVRMTDI